MESYQQLTQEKRYQIEAYLKSGCYQNQIAGRLGVHPSTICRELKRNGGSRVYDAKRAHKSATQRCKIASSHPIICQSAWMEVNAGLRQQWSPEQISGRMKTQHQDCSFHVSHEWIYHYIYADKQSGGSLHNELRCQKKRRKRYSSGRSKRGQIVGRVAIAERPTIVDERGRMGDWEGDTIIGKGHKQALVSIVERTSRFVVLRKVSRKTAKKVASAIIKGMAAHVNKVETITLDNGHEFAHHQHIAQELKANVYFADPYCSWQRGLNENTNGLVRQYAPKKQSFESITQIKADQVAHHLNHRPRKSLNFRTPYEVFYEINSENKIALGT